MLEKNGLDYYKKGEIISSWETNNIYWVEWEPDFAIMENNDNISCWNWDRIEEWEWKAKLSTEITSNVFEYLNKYIRTHFVERLSSNEILVEKCDMLPVECVFRFVAAWSKKEQYMYWDNATEDWTFLNMPIMELYYKGEVLTLDGELILDPMIKIWEGGLPDVDNKWRLCLLYPKTWEPIIYAAVFEWSVEKQLSFSDLKKQAKDIVEKAEKLFIKTHAVWHLINKFYSKVWITLFEWKIEFWINKSNELVLADVIDWDSCRLMVPYAVEWADGNIYLTWDFLPGELEKITWHNISYFEKLDILPEWMKVKRYVWVSWLDKEWFRDWWKVDETVKKYKVLAEKSSEALSKSKSERKDYNISSETIERVMEVIENI